MHVTAQDNLLSSIKISVGHLIINLRNKTFHFFGTFSNMCSSSHITNYPYSNIKTPDAFIAAKL